MGYWRRRTVPEVCRDAPFYFDPEEDGSLQRAVLYAFNNDEARGQAIERGREVAADYTWEKCGRETLALYRECQ
jgi:glycosyltransferase involved in cell wall biosynthesis